MKRIVTTIILFAGIVTSSAVVWLILGRAT